MSGNSISPNEDFLFNILSDAVNDYSEMAMSEKPEPYGNRNTYQRYADTAQHWLDRDRFVEIARFMDDKPL